MGTGFAQHGIQTQVIVDPTASLERAGRVAIAVFFAAGPREVDALSFQMADVGSKVETFVATA